MKILTLDEYADLANHEPDEFLIDQFLPYPGRILLVGPQKQGKSFLALQLGVAVAKGEPFLGRQTKQSKVLYLQYDTPHKIWMKRVSQARSYGLSFNENFIMIDPREPEHKKQIDVRKRLEDVGYLKSLVAEIKPELVIIDVLRKIYSGDENSSDITLEVFNILNDVFEQQSVVYIHHTHKLSPPPGQKIQARIAPGDAARGSSFMAGEVDATYLLFANQLTSESRVDEATTWKLEWDKVTKLWKFPDEERLQKLEQKIMDLYNAQSWSSWLEFRKFILHTHPTVTDSILTRIERLALVSQ